jgi:hypothetical protein
MTPTVMVAARVLGRQVLIPQPAGDDVPTPQQCRELLQEQAGWNQTLRAIPTTGSATRPAVPPVTVNTPEASAAAAVALWMLDPAVEYLEPASEGSIPHGLRGVAVRKLDRDSSAFYVQALAGSEKTFPGDYIAWHLGHSGQPQAFELAGRMLPPAFDPTVPAERQPHRVFNPNERSCGAMLLAIAAGNGAQQRFARERIESRLFGTRYGAETNFYAKGSYACALGILGDTGRLNQLRDFLGMPAFPQRRVVTALCMMGDSKVLDWMLWRPTFTVVGIDHMLAARGVNEVLAATAPDLPTVDVAPEPDLRHWQVQILRMAYAVKRQGLALGAPQP